MWKDGMKGVESKQKDKIYFKDFQSFLDSDSLKRYSQSSHESGASRGLIGRMSSARILASTIPLEIEPEESESATDKAESNGVATSKTPSRLSKGLSRMSSTAYSTKSRRIMQNVSETSKS